MKLYPFSCQRHLHDIEFLRNRLYNIITDIESGEMSVSAHEYSVLCDRFEGVSALRLTLYDYAPATAWLTGPQIDLAKRIAIWASEERVRRG